MQVSFEFVKLLLAVEVITNWLSQEIYISKGIFELAEIKIIE